MKKLKKMLACMLAACMLLAVSACGKAEEKTSEDSTKPAASQTEAAKETSAAEETEDAGPKEPVTLEWYYRGNGQQEDTDKVEAAVNELLKSYPGLEHVSISLNCFTGSEYAQQVLLSQTSGQQMDIINTVNLDFLTEVGNGTFMPMDEYLTESVRAELPDWLWNMAAVDGNIYMVPNYQKAMNVMFMLTPKEYMDKYGDLEKMKSVLTDEAASLEEKTEVLKEYVDAVQAGEGDTKWMSMWKQDIASTGSLGFQYGEPFDSLTKFFVVYNGSDQVEYIGTTEHAQETYRLAAMLQEGGYLCTDSTMDTAKLDAANMLNDMSNVVIYHEQIGTPERVAEIYSAAYGFDVTAIQVQKYPYIQHTWAAGGNGISSTCKHPAEAMLFIEALTTGTEIGKKIYNTLVFGLEGEHYTVDPTDPDRIETLEYTSSQGGVDTSYAAMKWIMGNTFYAYKNQAVLDDDLKIALEYNESPNTASSRLVGFTVKLEDIQTYIDQIKAVEGEYETTLLYGYAGVDGWEKTYKEYCEKLEAAGLSIVLKELQSQLDAFLGQ